MSKQGLTGRDNDVVENTIERAAEKADSTVAESEHGSRDAVSDAASSAKDAWATLKSWGKAAVSAVGDAWSTWGAWQEEGTPLRGLIRDAREGVDDAYNHATSHMELIEQKRKEKFEEMRKTGRDLFDTIDKSGRLSKCGEVGRQHPELVVGASTLAVALPSALGGGRSFIRNGVIAYTLSAGVMYGGPWFKQRILPKLRDGTWRDGP